MLKSNKSKKLSLSSETVRTLKDNDLAGVGGAGTVYTAFGCGPNRTFYCTMYIGCTSVICP